MRQVSSHGSGDPPSGMDSRTQWPCRCRHTGLPRLLLEVYRAPPFPRAGTFHAAIERDLAFAAARAAWRDVKLRQSDRIPAKDAHSPREEIGAKRRLLRKRILLSGPGGEWRFQGSKVSTLSCWPPLLLPKFPSILACIRVGLVRNVDGKRGTLRILAGLVCGVLSAILALALSPARFAQQPETLSSQITAGTLTPCCGPRSARTRPSATPSPEDSAIIDKALALDPFSFTTKPAKPLRLPAWSNSKSLDVSRADHADVSP